MNIKNTIIKFLGGYTLDEVKKIRNEYEIDTEESISRLKDWRRGMSMLCKDEEAIQKADKHLMLVVKHLPINY